LSVLYFGSSAHLAGGLLGLVAGGRDAGAGVDRPAPPIAFSFSIRVTPAAVGTRLISSPYSASEISPRAFRFSANTWASCWRALPSLPPSLSLAVSAAGSKLACSRSAFCSRLIAVA
jgi:hypothetical protein